MSALTIDHLHKHYGDQHILKDISIFLEEGKFVSLLGPSGCGKTTTLRCIAGFEVPDSGRILFNTRDVTRVEPEHRDVGMVFQSYALFPHMTVEENIGFGLEARKVPPADRRRRVADVLAMVRLEGFGGRFPRELSGGQQQRVALARALVIEPSVLLLDEPLANLDASLRDEMRFFIRDLQQRVGITSVYVTHDQSEAIVMSDMIVVMQAGEIAQSGTPRDIYERPTSIAVARFIGRSNTIEANVASALGGNGYVVETSRGRMAATGPEGLASGQSVHVMIRPENIRTEPRGDDENIMHGAVRKSVYQGNAQQLTIDVGQDETMVIDVSGKQPVAPGSDISVCFAPGDTWLIAA